MGGDTIPLRDYLRPPRCCVESAPRATQPSKKLLARLTAEFGSGWIPNVGSLRTNSPDRPSVSGTRLCVLVGRMNKGHSHGVPSPKPVT